jgi:RNA polymerase sigma factor (sigma-70 family)
MIKSSSLTQQNLNNLLLWLDQDRDTAGIKYEKIRRTLIKVFAARQCHQPEDLADETMSRVARRADELVTTYSGEPAHFFYGVAKNVHREYLRQISQESQGDFTDTQKNQQFIVWQSVEAETEEDADFRLKCMRKCLLSLPAGHQQIIRGYYEEGKKIANRRALAEQNKLSLNALRLKAHRLRRSLRECVTQCVESKVT